MDQKHPTINPQNGFNSKTKTFHSLRPPIKLPPEQLPSTVTAHSLSLQATSPWPDSVALIDSATGQKITYPELIHMINSLAFYLKTVIKLSKGDTAFVLSTNSVQVHILYLALLSIGVIVSPANPLNTVSEISRQIELSNPVIAFALSSTIHKLPKLRYGTILIDSPEFNSAMQKKPRFNDQDIDRVEVNQSNLAAIMYSSGTTGKVKAVMLTHRNLISVITGYYSVKEVNKAASVVLHTMPLFHVFGFFYFIKSVALSETLVVMGRFDIEKTVKAVEYFRVQRLATAPPVVVAMLKGGVTEGFDMSSLEWVGCGGAPLGEDVIAAFTEKFPNVLLTQGYGLTESGGGVFGFVGREACQRWGSVGKLAAYCEAKIVEPKTGEALPPCKQGELWLKGPCIMKGYAADPEATSATLVSDGWLRTGDLCYIDEEGFMFVVDRLKELIKYKGYQVAPVELEQLLQSHPQISDAAVIPYPDEEAGEIPMAFVSRQPQSSLSEAEIMDFVAKQVAPYKKIRRVAFIDSIPKNPAGKILRKELRKIAIPSAVPSSKL
ncbi:4-coumarate--CoA ligase-like 9 isoform X2 [Durio zibethinus]|uniref:4-coumarate--CoA ligase-like 9 isoform X2 n=1 Tax=Durio zibethinus TaxID=66656 RepID=A0A6P6B8Y1_DURZI|nr:4-coumarate--CoA ligase-like 9 isoform X2 [Durio zibethinus]